MKKFNIVEKTALIDTYDIGYSKYIAQSVVHEMGIEIADNLTKGKAHLVIPLKHYERESSGMFRKELVYSALLKEFSIPDAHSIMAGALLDTMMSFTEFIRVNHTGFVTLHYHYPSFNGFSFNDEVKPVNIRPTEVNMNPIYHDGRCIGAIGRCQECGKIFYSIIEEDEVI